MTSYYPVYLNLRGRRCIIVGGGTVAEGKISRLLDSGAVISVVSPDATPGIRQFVADGAVSWEERKYQSGDLDGAFIAIAATNEREVNRRVFEEAEQRGVMLNAVDDPPNCSFIAPSIVQRGPVTLAISTGGVSPALARKLRESLQVSDALAWADLSSVMAVARSHLREVGLLASIDPQRWQCCITPQLLSMVQDGRQVEATEFLLAGLTGDDGRGLCEDTSRCGEGRCQLARVGAHS
jgi:precorrin-2 dehydrogenase/sirohydrochlorin ferrochelatase